MQNYLSYQGRVLNNKSVAAEEMVSSSSGNWQTHILTVEDSANFKMCKIFTNLILAVLIPMLENMKLDIVKSICEERGKVIILK